MCQSSRKSFLNMLVAAAGFILCILGMQAVADDGPEDRAKNLRWFSPPGNPALQGAWVVGAEHAPGSYLLRVRLGGNGRILPHTHPDERMTTVLTGTLYVGFGNIFDESGMVAITAGGVYVAPANIPHYLWARDGEVIYQETGTGPTATQPLPR
jgi:quercetin dioxygenase-like cupin family protein